MKKGDFIILVVAILFAVSLFCFQSTEKQGEKLDIYIDGNLYGSYSLYEQRTITVTSEFGTNTVHIKDGKAFVTDSSCKDKNEILQGEINRAGESLICLPNRFIATVTGKEDVDSVSY